MTGDRSNLRHGSGVIAADAIAGGVLCVAGVWLLDPGLLDLGVHVEAPRFLLLGAVLGYCGLVFAHAAIFGFERQRNIVGEILAGFLGRAGLWSIGGLLLALSIRALWLGDASVAWLGVLAVPGALAFITLQAMARTERAAAPPPLPELHPASGKTEPFAFLQFLRRSVVLISSISTMFAVFAIAMLALLLLDIAFVQGRAIDPAAAFVGSVAFLLRWWVTALVLAVAFALCAGFLLALWSAMSRRAASDFDRDLSAEETSFVAAATRRIEDHVVSRGLRRTADAASAAFVVRLVVFGAVAIALLFLVNDLIAATYAPRTETWQLYVVEGDATAYAIALLVASLSLVPGAVQRLMSPLSAEAGGLGALDARAGAAGIQETLLALVRRRRLSPTETIEPAAVLQAPGRRSAHIALTWVALLTVALGAWWPLDRMRDTLYTELAIETGDAWTMERAEFPYDAVQSVRLACDGASVDYRIALPNGWRRSLFSAFTFTARLDEAVRIDDKLREAGVPFAFLSPGETATDEAGIIDRDCFESQVAGLDDEARAKAERVLHLDEWFERRWRQRTGTLSAARQ